MAQALQAQAATLSIATEVMLAAPAYAQDAAPAQEAEKATELDAVVVTGIRASLESALNAKRQDKGIVDVIKAEDMGK